MLRDWRNFWQLAQETHTDVRTPELPNLLRSAVAETRRHQNHAAFGVVKLQNSTFIVLALV